MPIYFRINNVTQEIQNAAEAVQLLSQVQNPVVRALPKSISAKEIVLVAQGEMQFFAPENTAMPATTGVTSCIIALFYNNKHERCIVHLNASYQLSWQKIFGHFSVKDIQCIVIGGVPIKNEVKNIRNINAFFVSLFEAMSTCQVHVTFERQQMSSDNLHSDMMNFFHIGTRKNVAKLRDMAFDLHGNVYDIEQYRFTLKETAPHHELRGIRLQEGEYRGWLKRLIDPEASFPLSTVLMLEEKEVPKELKYFHFHKLVLDFVDYLKEHLWIVYFCEFVTSKLYHTKDIHEDPKASDHYQQLMRFFTAATEYKSHVFPALQAQVTKHPKGPFVPEILSFTNDYSVEVEKAVGTPAQWKSSF